MSRKHFRALADALRLTGASLETIRAVASIAATTNENFDRERFIRAATEERD